MMHESMFECVFPERLPKIERLDENNIVLYVDAKCWLSSDYRDGVISTMEKWQKEPENMRYKVMFIPTRSDTKTTGYVVEQAPPKPSTWEILTAILFLVGALVGLMVGVMF